LLKFTLILFTDPLFANFKYLFLKLVKCFVQRKCKIIINIISKKILQTHLARSNVRHRWFTKQWSQTKESVFNFCRKVKTNSIKCLKRDFLIRIFYLLVSKVALSKKFCFCCFKPVDWVGFFFQMICKISRGIKFGASSKFGHSMIIIMF